MKKAICLALSACAIKAAFGIPANAEVFAEARTVDELQHELVQIHAQIKGIKARADAEKRDLTGDERDEFDRLSAKFDATEARIEMASSRPAGRKTEPDAPQDPQASANPNASRAQMDAGRARASVPAVPKDHRGKGMAGFNGVGDFLSSVMAASARGGPVDPRLIANAPTTFGQEAVGTDGGFAVPPDFRDTIVSKVMGEESLLKLTDQWTTSSNSITVPIDQTTPWQASGGIQAYWESEGGQKQQSKPQLGQVTVKANKVIALVPLTDELLEDSTSMANYVNRKAPEKIDFMVTDAIVNGTGVGQPLGILNSSGTIVVPAESGQAPDTVIYQNIANLWGRMAAKSRRTSVWLMNADSETQLQFMKFIDQGSGNAVPVYLPPGGLSASPYSTLYGRPIIVSEAMPALGNAGDIVLADMKQYLSVVKTSGIRQDVSIHLFFDYDITAFRFVLRVGGQPWWNSPIARPDGQTSRGFFVALGARA